MTYHPPVVRKANLTRHMRVLEACRAIGSTFTCVEIAKATGIESKYVAASIKYLREAQAITLEDKVPTPTGWRAVYSVTGDPVSQEAVAALHAMMEAKDKEPEEAVVRKTVNGVTKVRFGRKFKSGTGQTADGWRTRSSLEYV